MADFEWDPRKEALNVLKHGIDFTTASSIWDGLVVERPDDRRDYGEARFVAFGTVESRVLAVVYTRRGAVQRIISARIASRPERGLYEEEIRQTGRSPQN
jgi:hypothetical protein